MIRAANNQAAAESPFKWPCLAISWPFHTPIFCPQTVANLRAWQTQARPFFVAG